MIIGNNDLSSFSGFPQEGDRYQAMMNTVRDNTLHAPKILGQVNAATYAKANELSKDARFFQNGKVDPNAPPPGEK
jgi:hypothetical protein